MNTEYELRPNKKNQKKQARKQLAHLKMIESERAENAKLKALGEKTEHQILHNLGLTWVFPKNFALKETLQISQVIAKQFYLSPSELAEHFIKIEVMSDGLVIASENDGGTITFHITEQIQTTNN